MNGNAAADYVLADGGRLRYEVAGRGEPVVLVHGFALDRSLWEPQVAALASRYRVIRYDLRGFGESTLPAGPYDPSADLASLLESLDARPAHVVGLSLGGRVALGLALARPADVRSLTLVDATLDGYPMSDDWTARWRAVVAAGRGGDLAGAKQLWLGHPVFATAQARPRAAATLAATVERYSGWHWNHKDPVVSPGVAAIERLGEVRAPTLVVVGEDDLPDFQGIARRLATGIAGARLEIIAGAGHVPNVEAPEAFNAVLLAHLAAASG